MSKKIILFIGPYIHLSIPQYKELVPHLNEYSTIYFDISDPHTIKYGINLYNENDLKLIFDKVLSVEANFENGLKGWRTTSFIEKVKSYRKHKKKIERVLNEVCPDVIVSTADGMFNDRVAIQWTLNNDVPFVLLQPSFIGGINKDEITFFNKLKLMLLNPILGVPLYKSAKYFGDENHKTYSLLWSEEFSKNMDKDRIHYIGNPQLDPLLKQQGNEIGKIKHVGIFTQDTANVWNEELENEIFQIYEEAITEMPEIDFTIKIHPRESEEKIKKRFDSFENVNIINSGEAIEIIKQLHCLISIASYSAIQAAALGVFTISVVPPDLNIENKELLGVNVSKIVKNGEELITAINSYQEKRTREEFYRKREDYFKKYYLSTDGKSGLRFKHFIDYLLTNNNM